MEQKTEISNRQFIINHLILLALILAVAAVLYLVLGNPTTVVASVVALVLAHLGAVLGIGLIGRKLWRRLHS